MANNLSLPFESDDDETQPLRGARSPHLAITVPIVVEETFSQPPNNPISSRTCRICFEGETGEPSDPLISPCLCTGSSMYVHRSCLDRWRTTKHRSDAFYQCEVCKFQYKFKRLWWAGFLGSQWTLVTCFLSCLVFSIWALGFIPILGGSLGLHGASLHILNGMVCLGILGLVGSIVAVCLGLCGHRGMQHMFFCPGMCQCYDMPLLMGGGAAECGVVLLGIFVVVGFVVACAAVYRMLWYTLQSLLENAQYMVENVNKRPGSAAREGEE